MPVRCQLWKVLSLIGVSVAVTMAMSSNLPAKKMGDCVRAGKKHASGSTNQEGRGVLP